MCVWWWPSCLVLTQLHTCRAFTSSPRRDASGPTCATSVTAPPASSPGSFHGSSGLRSFKGAASISSQIIVDSLIHNFYCLRRKLTKVWRDLYFVREIISSRRPTKFCTVAWGTKRRACVDITLSWGLSSFCRSSFQLPESIALRLSSQRYPKTFTTYFIITAAE